MYEKENAGGDGSIEFLLEEELLWEKALAPLARYHPTKTLTKESLDIGEQTQQEKFTDELPLSDLLARLFPPLTASYIESSNDMEHRGLLPQPLSWGSDWSGNEGSDISDIKESSYASVDCSPALTTASTSTDVSEIEDRKVRSYQLYKACAVKATPRQQLNHEIFSASFTRREGSTLDGTDDLSKPAEAEISKPSVTPGGLDCNSTAAARDLTNPLKNSMSLNVEPGSKQVTPTDPSRLSTRSDTFSSFTEDGTDWGEEVTGNDDLHFPGFSAFSVFAEGSSNLDDDIRDSLTRPVLSPMKRSLVDRIMKEFWSILDQETHVLLDRTISTPAQSADSALDMSYDSENHDMNDIIIRKRHRTPRPGFGDDSVPDLGFHQRASTAHGGETQSPGTSSGSKSRTNNTSQETSKNSVGKRRRDDEDERDQNGGGDRSPKRPKKFSSPPQNEDDTNKFACPYRKRDPRKYCIQHWRPCSLTPLESIARVKGHLYRHHRIFPCQRCKQLFRNQDEVNSHLRESKVCELSDDDLADGVTADIVEKLQSKKTAQRTEVERWQDIYKLLFPNEMVPSHYFEAVQEDLVSSPDSGALADYEAYCRRELPGDFRAALEEIVHSQSQPIEESIRNQLVEIIRDCQDRISSRYRFLMGTGTTPPRATGNCQSQLAAPQENGTGVLTSTHATSGDSAGCISPSFLQPPPPQSHLESRLEVSDIQINSSKPKSGSELSDSGYSSNGAGSHRASFSLNTFSSDDISLPSSQIQAEAWPISLDQGTLDMNDLLGDMNPGNDIMDSQYSGAFNDSWWTDDAQYADEGSGNLFLGDKIVSNNPSSAAAAFPP
ncbi:hypothetical protein V8E51_010584 [Hyaloscypha variabilis]